MTFRLRAQARPRAHGAALLAALGLVACGAAAEPSVLELNAEVGVLGRAFRYTDPLSDYDPDLSGQRPADNVTPTTPLFRLRVESFPLAALTRAWPAHLGLHADMAGALPTNVRSGPGASVQGSQSQGHLLLGAQGLIPVASLELTPRASFGLHGWYLAQSDGSARPFPNVTYQFLEFGLNARAPVDALSIEGDLAVRAGLSAGEIESAEWFPNTSFYGMVAGVSVGWALHRTLALRLHLEFVQYGLTFNPEVGRPPDRVVGGATDQSVSACLGLEWRLPSPLDAR